MNDLLADPRLIDLREDVRQHERLDARPLGDDRVVAVVAAGRPIARCRLGSRKVVVHVNQHVAAERELSYLV